MEDLARYSCQLALPGFGKEAQAKLMQARVLIIGMGGLGCPAAQYLASSGIGTLGIADFDTISISNLHRQILYTEEEVGQKKVAIAGKKLQKQNPQINIIIHDIKISDKNIEQLISGYDIVVDATDNFETHYLINDACVLAKKLIIHGAIYQYEGHVAVWNMPNSDETFSPNYRDVFPSINSLLVPDCTDGGVLPTITGIIGTMQANETIKTIIGSKNVLKGKMLVFDAQSMQSRIINIGAHSKTNITQLPSSVDIPFITKDELRTSNNHLLIDVRTAEEHNAFNIGGINIPIHALEDNIAQLDATRKIIFYCASGKRSMRAAKWLKEKSRTTEVLSLEDGIRNW
jgi:molybdopterin/thiamine biosynthesis adenylyltransferase/rhodanese-related sulfurtransferase